MTPEFYRVLHVVGALLLFLSLGTVFFTPRDKKPPKLAMALHGIALVVMVVAGVGVVHKAGLEWGNWLYAKIACWVLLAALPTLVRKGTVPGIVGLLLAIGLGGAAAWLAIAETKPF